MNHKKIAELVNVSASTVSKALSGSSEISDELAERIRKIAIESGYFKEKSRRKREYTNNRSLVIAVIVPEILGSYYANIVTFIKNEIESRGGLAAVYIFDFDDTKRDSILESIILQGTVDGIIIFSVPDSTLNHNLPIVCLHGKNENCRYDSVSGDTSAIIEDIIVFLKELGHTKIAFVGEMLTSYMEKVFITTLEKFGLPVNNNFIYKENERFEAIGIEAAKKIIAAQNCPTAVVAAYDEIALALVYELTNAGIKVPDDISVVGINNIAAGEFSQIPLTTVETFSAEKYKIAVDLLFDKILNETIPVKHISLEHKLIVRDTTKKAGDDTSEA